MVRTGIYLQTLRTLPETLTETIARVGATALEGVEFAGLEGTPPSDIADALDDWDLEAVGAHVAIERIEGDYESVVDAYATIGCKRFIVSGAGPALDPSVDVDAAANRLSNLAKRLGEDGFELLYHNGTSEFGGDVGETAYDAIVSATGGSVDLELDTGLATYAGTDPTALLSRYADRTPLVHLTDAVPGSDATRHVEVGAGELGVEACVEAARAADVEWLVYEHGRTSDPLGSLAHAATNLPMVAHGRSGDLRSDFARVTD